MRWPLRARFTVGWVACWAGAVLVGCQTQEKVVRYKPFFSGLDGAEFIGQQPVGGSGRRVDPTAYGGEELMIEHPDGTRQLISKSPRHVMTHLERLLDQGDDRTLLDQLISEQTHAEFKDKGGDEAILEFLQTNRREIARTFSRMPLAEHTPTVIVDQPGNKTWVIRVTGKPAEDLRFRSLWVRMERGQWKFVWLT